MISKRENADVFGLWDFAPFLSQGHGFLFCSLCDLWDALPPDRDAISFSHLTTLRRRKKDDMQVLVALVAKRATPNVMRWIDAVLAEGTAWAR